MYRVDSSDKLGRMFFLTNSSDTSRYTIQYYDNKGFYTGSTIISGRDTLAKTVYDYNSKGDIIKETIDSKGSGHSQQVNDYIYDQFANWTSKTSVFTYNDGRKFRMKTVRAITYAEQ